MITIIELCDYLLNVLFTGNYVKDINPDALLKGFRRTKLETLNERFETMKQFNKIFNGYICEFGGWRDDSYDILQKGISLIIDRFNRNDILKLRKITRKYYEYDSDNFKVLHDRNFQVAKMVYLDLYLQADLLPEDFDTYASIFKLKVNPYRINYIAQKNDAKTLSLALNNSKIKMRYIKMADEVLSKTNSDVLDVLKKFGLEIRKEISNDNHHE